MKPFEFISFVFIFLVFTCLIVDISAFRVSKENLKDSIDLSSKAAALQIDQTPSKIANGIFEIDNNKATIIFLDVMSKNLNLSATTIRSCMVEYKAINNIGDYINPIDHKAYHINNPTYVALMKYKWKGILLTKEIVVSNNFGASELRER